MFAGVLATPSSSPIKPFSRYGPITIPSENFKKPLVIWHIDFALILWGWCILPKKFGKVKFSLFFQRIPYIENWKRLVSNIIT